MRPLRQRGLLVALAALAACARCGGTAGPPPERYVPADSLAAVVVPEIRGAVRSLAEFYSTAEDFPGTSDLPSLRASLSAQLGFDPFHLAALRESGIDPFGGMAVAFPAPSAAGNGRPAPLLVLPISNRAAADAFVRRLALDRLGAGVRTVQPVGAVQVTVFRARAGGPPALAVGDGEATFVLSTGPDAPAAVGRALSLPAGEALSGLGAWSVVRAAAEREAAAIAFLPPASKLLEGQWAFRDGVALALSAEAKRLRTRLIVLLADREPGFLALAAEGEGGAVAARLDPASAIVGRWDGDPAPLGEKLLPLLPAPELAQLRGAGIDLRQALFDALAPGAAASLSLPPRLDLPTIDAQRLRRDPLRLVQFELVLPLRDPPKIVALSDRVARLAGQRPARGGPWAVPTPSGEVAWALDGDRVVVAGGAKGRLAALRARLAEAAGGYRAPTDVARHALAAGGLGALVLDTQNFVASVRALPSSAFGTGPSGFVMRSLVGRFVDPAERIEAATLRADLAPGALVLTLDVEPRPAEEHAP